MFLGPLGGRKSAAPEHTVDTLRGGRKGDPQQKVVGKMVGGEDSKYRCVVKIGFQKTSLYRKRIGKTEKITTITTMTVFLGPRGGRKRAVPADTVDTLRGGRKGDPQHKVVGKISRLILWHHDDPMINESDRN